jgi:hypothetical protein
MMAENKTRMENVVFALCEGQHDISFLYRLFTAQGFTGYKEIIGNFPDPIDRLIITALKATDYEKMKLMEVGKKPIPQEILVKDESLVLLYALGGDGQKKSRKDLISSIFAFKPPDDDALDVGKGLDYSIIYFYDANEKGVGKRLQGVEQEIKELFDVKHAGVSNGGKPVRVKGFKIGCYIFAGNNSFGKLEDIMMPIMEKGNETIFKEAEKFLELKDENRLKKLRLKRNQDGSIEEFRSNEKMKFDGSKSSICIAGQLQNSGKSNVVIIKDCDFINLEKIRDCSKCREIMQFIDRVILK